MAELRLTGRFASSGFAAGPVAVLSDLAAASRRSGDPEAEASALRDAMVTAIAQLSQLAIDAQHDGAAILGFQIAMLGDELLAAPAFAAIAGGTSADLAWRVALDVEIEGYEADDDEHFRARASDLRDIRERVLAILSSVASEPSLPAGAIVLAEDLTPSRFLATDWSNGGGIVLTRGSASGHVAMLARSRGVPMIVGMALDLGAFGEHREALIDGECGTLCLDPSPATRQSFAARASAANNRQERAEAFGRRPAMTRDGTPIAVLINVADPVELEDARSRDLRRHRARTHRISVRPQGRTAGRGKPVSTLSPARRMGERQACHHPNARRRRRQADPGLTLDGESNPFLGVRGIRLSLAKPEPFRAQLRAIARAAVHGAVEVMLPMVALPDELAAGRRYLDREIESLTAEGIACRRPPLGIMVEVPAAAIAIERLRRRLLLDRLE